MHRMFAKAVSVPDQSRRHQMCQASEIHPVGLSACLKLFVEEPSFRPIVSLQTSLERDSLCSIQSLAKRSCRFQTTHVKLLMSRHQFPTTLPNASMFTGAALRWNIKLAHNPYPLTLHIWRFPVQLIVTLKRT